VKEKPKQNQNLHKEEINELEDRLKRANQVIASLQQQNTELKKKAVKPQTIASSSSQVTRTHQTKNHQTPGASMSKSRFSQLSHLQFYALTASVVLFIISLFGISSFLSHRDSPKNFQSVKNTSLPTAQAIPSLATASAIPVDIANQSQPITQLNSNPQLVSNTSQFIYNVITPPKLSKGDKKLDKIVNNLVNYAKENKLPTNSLSITLIDLNKGTTAAYQENTLRYPASVVKLFLMVALQAKIKQGQVQFTSINNDLSTMMLRSDNDAASNVLDAITNTKSSDKSLGKEEFATWKNQRQSLNDFFQKAGYKDINVSQKTFPLPLHNIQEPKGADAQIRGDNPNSPRRNKVTTYQAARLMYEIAKGEAVAPEYQEQMLSLLKRDLGYWQSQPINPEEFDPVRDLFGEKLPANRVEFYSKAGWTTTSRQEVAYVVSKGGKARYILAIFGNDKAYGDNKKAFPQMSRLVFDEMTK
jgi:beta-lactamase class A